MRDEYLVEKIPYRGYVIKIMQDSDPQFDFDLLSSRVCWHRNYTLSSDNIETRTDNKRRKQTSYKDVLSFEAPEDFQQFCKENKVLVFSLFLYDHSGITISMEPFSCPWDSGQCGWVFVTYEEIRKEYKVKKVTKKLLKKVEEVIQGEVKLFDNYLTGEVYGFVIEKENGEESGMNPMEVIDSCWGFYGDTDYMIGEAKSSIDYQIKIDRKSTQKKIKTRIKNKAPLEYREPIEENLYAR